MSKSLALSPSSLSFSCACAELVDVDDLVDLALHLLLEGLGAGADAVGDAPFGGLTARRATG